MMKPSQEIISFVNFGDFLRFSTPKIQENSNFGADTLSAPAKVSALLHRNRIF